MSTTTVTSDWFNPYWGARDGAAAWASPQNVVSANGVVTTADSNTGATYSTSSGYGLYPYGFRFTDPRPSLPTGYMNFRITAIQVQIKGSVSQTVVGDGEQISVVKATLQYNADTTPWTYPRVGPISTDGNWTTSNAYLPVIRFASTAQNTNTNTTGHDTFSPSKVFADAAANYNQGPMVRIAIFGTTGTPVGTYSIDHVRARIEYAYDMPESGGSSGAKHFFFND